MVNFIGIKYVTTVLSVVRCQDAVPVPVVFIFLILLKVKREGGCEQKPSISVCMWVLVCDGENYIQLRCEPTLSSTFTHAQGQAI
jgi:hypothetical protein